MKVAIYYPWVYLPGGPERTIVEILARSRHTWTLFTNHYDRAATFPALRQATVVQLGHVSVKRSFLPVARAALRIALQKMPLEGFDALLVCCDGLGDLALLRNSTIPAACLCFTPLRAAFDRHYQNGYLTRNRGRFWRAPMLWAGTGLFRVIDRFAWGRYRRVFAISNEVRRRITAGKLYPEGEIDLVHPGVDLSRLTPTGVYEKDFVIPGRIMWTKNLELAIEAFQRLLERRADLRCFTLTLAGHVDRKSEPYLAKLRELAGTCDRIRFVVSLSDDEMRARCQRSYAVLYPPFNEDWGLIPLEAMALEKAVIAVNRGGPRETIVHGETGLLVEPTVESFAVAMEKLADDPELVRSMGLRARTHVRRFEWSHFCAELDQYLEQLSEPAPVSEIRSAPLASHER